MKTSEEISSKIIALALIVPESKDFGKYLKKKWVSEEDISKMMGDIEKEKVIENNVGDKLYNQGLEQSKKIVNGMIKNV